jgi:hypothetical protein
MFCVVILDLEGFKHVSNIYGLHAGDSLPQQYLPLSCGATIVPRILLAAGEQMSSSSSWIAIQCREVANGTLAEMGAGRANNFARRLFNPSKNKISLFGRDLPH